MEVQKTVYLDIEDDQNTVWGIKELTEADFWSYTGDKEDVTMAVYELKGYVTVSPPKSSVSPIRKTVK